MVRIVKKPHERRAEIVIAACELFLTKGYEKTTMRDVMTQVQIAKGTIYHYFKSKDELLDAVITHIAEQELEKLKQIVLGVTGNALEKIKLVVQTGNKQEHEQDFLDQLHQPSNSVMHIRLLACLVTMQAPIHAELIRQGCEEGIFSTDTPLECAEFILAGIQFLTDQGIYPWSEEHLQRRIAAFPGLVESLLNAPKGSFQFLLEIGY